MAVFMLVFFENMAYVRWSDFWTTICSVYNQVDNSLVWNDVKELSDNGVDYKFI